MFPEVPKKFPSIMAKLKTAAAVEIGNVPWKFPKSEAVLKAVHTFTVGNTS
jgi:hypothetical protein